MYNYCAPIRNLISGIGGIGGIGGSIGTIGKVNEVVKVPADIGTPPVGAAGVGGVVGIDGKRFGAEIDGIGDIAGIDNTGTGGIAGTMVVGTFTAFSATLGVTCGVITGKVTLWSDIPFVPLGPCAFTVTTTAIKASIKINFFIRL